MEGERVRKYNPEALVNTMWWILTQHLGLRGWQEHHDLKVDNFQLCKDNIGVEFVQFTAGRADTILESSDKTFANHSARRRL